MWTVWKIIPNVFEVWQICRNYLDGVGNISLILWRCGKYVSGGKYFGGVENMWKIFGTAWKIFPNISKLFGCLQNISYIDQIKIKSDG